MTPRSVARVTARPHEPVLCRLRSRIAHSPLGVISALTILSLWSASLLLVLSTDLARISPLLILLAVLIRTFLQTGLFITAHDAMHGTVAPANRPLNTALGSVCTWLYALIPYRPLLAKHGLHHGYPASIVDPDYHGQQGAGAMLWYLRFMGSYLMEWHQAVRLILGMGAISALACVVFQVNLLNLLLFWILPLVLSSVQLFYFGTYLPHRRPEQDDTNRHRARSTPCSTFWSFVSCYHFGYHWEHHEYPQLPWFALPRAYNHSCQR